MKIAFILITPQIILYLAFAFLLWDLQWVTTLGESSLFDRFIGMFSWVGLSVFLTSLFINIQDCQR